MVGVDPREARRLRIRDQLVVAGEPSGRGGRLVRVEVSHEDRVLHRWQCVLQRGDCLATIEYLAVEAVPIDRDQQLRRDLSEAIDHAPGAEVRRARGPDGAQAGRRE